MLRAGVRLGGMLWLAVAVHSPAPETLPPDVGATSISDVKCSWKSGHGHGAFGTLPRP